MQDYCWFQLWNTGGSAGLSKNLLLFKKDTQFAPIHPISAYFGVKLHINFVLLPDEINYLWMLKWNFNFQKRKKRKHTHNTHIPNHPGMAIRLLISDQKIPNCLAIGVSAAAFQHAIIQEVGRVTVWHVHQHLLLWQPCGEGMAVLVTRPPQGCSCLEPFDFIRGSAGKHSDRPSHILTSGRGMTFGFLTPGTAMLEKMTLHWIRITWFFLKNNQLKIKTEPKKEKKRF